MSLEIYSENPAVSAVLTGSAPRPAQLAASKGLLPLPGEDLLELLVGLADGEDPELSANARQALGTQAIDSLEVMLRSAKAAPTVLSHFARSTSMPVEIHDAVLSNPATPVESLETMARSTSDGGLLERISLNQQLLIRNSAIIEAILANPNRSPEAERRAAETKREFFEKERGAAQIASELRAQGNEAAAEFLEQAEFAEDLEENAISVEDALLIAKHIEVLDKETDDSWLSLEYIEEIYEESEEQRQAIMAKILGELSSEDEATNERISVLNRIMRMGVKDRVKLGMKGDREARNILIRDPNKLVASAVINNPKITEQEVEKIASMRTVPEEVLRQIAMNKQWSRGYLVQLSLARNPRTPLGNSMSIMNRLQLRDLQGLTKDRNVPEAVRKHALRLVTARTGGKG